MTPLAEREFDVVVWGATGFTGGLCADYLASRGGSTRWALAGRDSSALETLSATLRNKHKLMNPLNFILANLENEISLTAMTNRTKVLISIVGPYALCGEPVIRACVNTGTDYVDGTAELDWMRNMQKKYSAAAAEKNVKLISCCGFDFVPNDMMMFQLTRHLCQPEQMHKLRAIPRDVTFAVKYTTTWVSGGTAFSGLHWVRSRPMTNLIGYFVDSHALCRDDSDFKAPSKISQDLNRYQILPHPIPERGFYCVPFVMSSLMNKYVHWSNHNQNYLWGRDLVYRGGEVKTNYFVALWFASLLWFQFFCLIIISRLPVLWKYLPKQGTGPEVQVGDHYVELTTLARVDRPSAPGAIPPNANDESVTITWRYNKGEAYKSAAMFMVEAALCLAHERSDCPAQNGMYPPSAALGQPYIERLARAGIQMSIHQQN